MPRTLALPPKGASLPFPPMFPLKASLLPECKFLSALAKKVLLHLRGFLTALRSISDMVFRHNILITTSTCLSPSHDS